MAHADRTEPRHRPPAKSASSGPFAGGGAVGSESPINPVSRMPTDSFEVRRAVASALQGLVGRAAEAVELAYYGGLTHAEIAHELDTPLGTIRAGRARRWIDSAPRSGHSSSHNGRRRTAVTGRARASHREPSRVRFGSPQEPERIRVEHHLGTCSTCASSLEQYRGRRRIAARARAVASSGRGLGRDPRGGCAAPTSRCRAGANQGAAWLATSDVAGPVRPCRVAADMERECFSWSSRDARRGRRSKPWRAGLDGSSSSRARRELAGGSWLPLTASTDIWRRPA